MSGPGIRIEDLTVPRTARVAALGEPGAPELWLLLHGYGQLAERFLRSFQPAARADRLLVAPEALSRFYTSREPSRVGATWMTREARDAEITDYLGYLDLVMERYAAGAGRIEVHGFSQGTATATRWVEHAMRPIRRLVLWGGGIAPEINLAGLRQRQPDLEWHFCIGRDDEFITDAAVAAELDRLDRAGVPYTIHSFEGGHVVDAGVLAELGAR